MSDCMLTNTNRTHSPDLNSLGFYTTQLMTDIFAWATGDPSPVLQCIFSAGNAVSIHRQRRINLWGPRTMELVLLSKGRAWGCWGHLNEKQLELQGCTPCELQGFASAWKGCGCLGSGASWPSRALASTAEPHTPNQAGPSQLIRGQRLGLGPGAARGHLPVWECRPAGSPSQEHCLALLNVLG